MTSHAHLATASSSRPGDLSPSFAQTGAELNLDDSDIEDLDLHAEVGHGEVYEMRGRGDAWDVLHDATNHDRTGSPSTVASFQLYTPDEENSVRRKFDRKLVVFVALLYMLSFLDRSSTLELREYEKGG
jgi:hypothetical protein